VVTICRSGRRSLTAADILLAAGFRDVHSLAGGMGAWHDAGLPVER
jgi:rhodanese-related sulfurtransferase